MNIKAFIIDYCQRHIHPVNAVLHIVGVPVVVYGLVCLFHKSTAAGLAFIALGYFFQYVGHRTQGNEVGEVTLIKNCLRLLITKIKLLNANKSLGTSAAEFIQKEDAQNQ